MAVQPGLCGAWSETQKTGFLTTRLILQRQQEESPVPNSKKKKEKKKNKQEQKAAPAQKVSIFLQEPGLFKAFVLVLDSLQVPYASACKQLKHNFSLKFTASKYLPDFMVQLHTCDIISDANGEIRALKSYFMF